MKEADGTAAVARAFKPRRAGAAEGPKPALVLAAFGTTEATALPAIVHIARRARAAFPEREVFLAFTSGFVRRVWRRRAEDQDFRRQFPGIPEEVYQIPGPLGILAALADEGPRPAAVQSLHVAAGEEFEDLAAVVRQLAGIAAAQPSRRPFPELRLGLPALGYGNEDELRRAAEALAPLIRQAGDATLVFMGHGRHDREQAAYGNLEKILRATYDRPIHIGLVEGSPGRDKVLAALPAHRPGRIFLAPLMVVAGEHAKNDLAGPGPDSWAGALTAAGHEVTVHLQGLGMLDSWADLYLANARRALADSQDLKI